MPRRKIALLVLSFAATLAACVAVLSLLVPHGLLGPQLRRCETGAVARASDDDLVLFFHDRGCPDCAVVEATLLPRLLEQNGLDESGVRRLDVSEPEAVRLLLELEGRLGFRAGTLAPVVIVRGRAYCGVSELREAFGFDGRPSGDASELAGKESRARREGAGDTKAGESKVADSATRSLEGEYRAK